MPLYDFECEPCMIEATILCKYSEVQNQQCSICGAKLTKKVTAVDTFKFRGVEGSATMGS